LNGVLFASNEAAIEAAEQQFRGIPALWHTWPGITPVSVETALLARGHRFIEQEPVMMRSIASDLHFEHDTTVEEASSVEAVSEGISVWLGRSPDARTASIVDALVQFPFGPHESRHFLVHRLDGEAIACANVFVVDRVAAIENVVTSERHRGRGIGTAMTQAALAVAHRSGATRALLTASPDGERIYRSLGFSEVGTVRRFG
jgi:GNAT superfamily N-acetyltransferase